MMKEEHSTRLLPCVHHPGNEDISPMAKAILMDCSNVFGANKPSPIRPPPKERRSFEMACDRSSGPMVQCRAIIGDQALISDDLCGLNSN